MSTSAAYHEAGHFVVGYVLRDEANPLSIIPDSIAGTEGSCGTLDAPGTEAEIADFVCELFAGAAAERRLGGDEMEIAAGARQDEELAKDYLARIGVERESELRQRTERVLDEHWRAVEVVGKVLAARRRLRPEEAEWIFDVANGDLDSLRPLRSWCRESFELVVSVLEINVSIEG